MEIRLTPIRTLFENEDDNFGIYGCEVHAEDAQHVEKNMYGNISIKGISPKLTLGEEYVAKLKQDGESKYKGSYLIESIRQEKPTTADEQRKFFQMILTEHQLDNIYRAYDGQDIIQLIQDDTFDHHKVKGLGEKTYEKMREKVLTNLEMSELLVFLATHGIRFNMVQALVKHYKNPQIVIQKIKDNPYILTEVKGIGFHKADAIAKAMKYDLNSPFRMDACIHYIIDEENANGHSWIGYKQLLNRAIDYLTISRSLIEERLTQTIEGVMNLDNRFTKERIYKAESYVAEQMVRLKTQSGKLVDPAYIENFLDTYCQTQNVTLEENQRQFFHDWNENAVLLLVGGGGVGKSWLQRILLDLIDTLNLSTALLSPTGRASKVQSQYTGRPASTIHRKTGSYGDNGGSKEATITEDILVVDEASMCDIFILSRLFESIAKPNVRILFVGDDFQLPSVGVGNFLYDVIHSQAIKVSRLKKVFRQEKGGILNVATDVREGNTFMNSTAEGRLVFGSDCVFWMTDQDYVKDGVLTNYRKVLQKFEAEDVIILSPTNKGKLGTIALNKEIQQIANPPAAYKKEKAVGKKTDPTIYRVGDAVMNLVNTYDMDTVEEGTADVFNGDTGKIIDIDDTEKVFVIDFEGVQVKLKFALVMNNLTHAWVTTIHKSQGSQYKVVITIMDKSMKFQLNANLIYTGFSRAKNFMLVLGQADTINHGMKKFANMERRSFLQERLDAYNESIGSL